MMMMMLLMMMMMVMVMVMVMMMMMVMVMMMMMMVMVMVTVMMMMMLLLMMMVMVMVMVMVMMMMMVMVMMMMVMVTVTVTMMMIDGWWWWLMMDDDDDDDDGDGDGDGDGDDDGDDDDGDGDGDGDDDDDDDDDDGDGDGDGDDDDDDHQQSNLRLSPIFRQTRIGQGSIPNKTEHLMIPPFVIHSHPNIFWRFRQHFWDVHKGIWVKWLMPIFLGELVHPPIVHHGSRPQVFVPFYCRLQACKQDRLDQELLVVWPQMSRRRSGKSGKKSWLSRGFYMVPCKMEIEQTKMRTSPTKMVIQFILYAVLCGYIRTISSLT